MELKTNSDRLVMQSVMGKIHHPTVRRGGPFLLTHNGKSTVLPSVGGITYNVAIGDSVYAMRADHVEPGVTILNPDERENGALTALSCIGNDAVVATGDAKGAKGFVTGCHGGIEHTILYFALDVLDRMFIGDSILIRAWGQGMILEDFPEVTCTGLDPRLLDRMGITADEGRLQVPVTAVVPSHLIGAGMGSGSGFSGDCDLMTADWKEICRCGLDRLRYGDFVLLEDCDNGYGRGYLKGACSVGVVVHSDSLVMGHGPGITTVMTSKQPLIRPVIDVKANLTDYMRVNG